MKKNEVEIGKVYVVKVSGRLARVRLTGENPYGGWDGVNVATGRKVRIKSAQRLRYLARQQDPPASSQANSQAVRAALQERTRQVAEKVREAREAAQAAATAKKDAETASQSGAAEKRTTGEPGGPDAATTTPTRRRGRRGTMSGLDAAAKVLAEAGEPLNCVTITARALAKGYWKTGGKTPQATVYAAIIREIAKKGDASRFRKTERGRFELAK